MASFSLIRDPWIPASRGGDSVEWICPCDLVALPDLPLDVSWGRPDLRIATYELLIGMLTVAMSPKDEREWERLFAKPPTPQSFNRSLKPLEAYFVLDGDGLRFMQDLEPITGAVLNPDALFIDAPGAQTLRNNADLFVKQGRTLRLSRAVAAVALYALQSFAPVGGRGNRVSMRGGGPLTTLAMPSETTLWQKLWTNVPVLSGRLRVPKDLSRVFPWAVSTRTSETGQVTQPLPEHHAHPLQAYFGMPRRIRLVLEQNADRQPCSLTGRQDEVVVTGFVMRPYGVDYGVWKHPLTPYYIPRTGGADLLPVHPKSSSIGYRQWLGLLYNDEGHTIATCVSDAKHRLRGRASVVAAGYVMDNMKVLDYAEADLPLHVLGDRKAQAELETFARALVHAADGAAANLRSALRRVFFDAKWDATVVAAPLQRFWGETEAPFRAMLSDAARYGADKQGDSARRHLREVWRGILERDALSAFDAFVPLEMLSALRLPQRQTIIRERRNLYWTLRGFGKEGAKLYGALGLPLPERKAKELVSG